MTVTRSAGTTGIVGCTISVAPITATEGADYNVEIEQLQFIEGQNTTTFMIAITNDPTPELEEVKTCMPLRK